MWQPIRSSMGVIAFLIGLLPSAGKELDCVLNNRAFHYRGTWSRTKSGLTCQAWTAQSPHRNPNCSGIEFESNYCRNIARDGSDYTCVKSKPWCYTMDPTKIWEVCDIPKCGPKECRMDKHDDTITTTVSGRTCQEWKLQVPHHHYCTDLQGNTCKYTPNHMESICREHTPWCYTTSPDMRWEFCDFPNCGPITTQMSQTTTTATISTTQNEITTNANMSTTQNETTTNANTLSTPNTEPTTLPLITYAGISGVVALLAAVTAGLIYAFAKRKKTDEEEHQEETEPDHVSSEEYTWMPSLFSWYGDDAPE